VTKMAAIFRVSPTKRLSDIKQPSIRCGSDV
jgi:hypothetical protein